MFNYTELTAYFTRVMFNVSAIVGFLKAFVSGTAQDVDITIKQENGTLETSSFWNIKKNQDNQRIVVAEEMSKTLYVDAINGSDSNTGTSDSPFATIKKAIDSVPAGGSVSLKLMDGTHTITEDIVISNKEVSIHGNSDDIDAVQIVQSGRTIVDGGVNYELSYGIYLRSSSIQFVCCTINGFTKTGELDIYLRGGLIKRDDFRKKADISFLYSNINIGDEPLVKNAGGNVAANIHVYLSKIDMVGQTNQPITKLEGNCCNFALINVAFGTEVNGSTINTQSLITGILRDVDGKPINVLSNIDL